MSGGIVLSTSHKHRIVLLDPDQTCNPALHDTARTAGVEVLSIADFSDAYAPLANGDVSLLVLSGCSLAHCQTHLAQCLADIQRHQTPVIFLCDDNHPDAANVMEHAATMGITDVFFQPMSQTVWQNKLRPWLDVGRHQQKLTRAVLAMKQQRDQLARWLSVSEQPVLAIDEQGVVRHVSGAFLSLMPDDNPSPVGHPLSTLLWLDEFAIEPFSWQNALTNDDNNNGQSHILYLINQDHCRSVYARLNPIRTHRDTLAGALITLTPTVASPSGEERRQFPRQLVRRTLLVFDRDSGVNMGKLVNLSPNGFCIQSPHLLDVDAVLQLGMVLPTQLEGANTVGFEARVVWREPSGIDGDYLIGFQIARVSQTTQQILQMLITSVG